MDEPFDEIVANGTGTHALEEYYSQNAVMVAYGSVLDKAERDSIRDWLNSFPKPTTGAALYADYCSYCHGADGRGADGSTGASPKLVGAYATVYHSAPFTRLDRAGEAAYVRAGHMQEGNTPVEPSERRAYMPAFPSSVLSDQELDLILAWLPQ